MFCLNFFKKKVKEPVVDLNKNKILELNNKIITLNNRIGLLEVENAELRVEQFGKVVKIYPI